MQVPNTDVITGADIMEKYRAIKATEPRDRSASFAPELTFEAGRVICRAPVTEGCTGEICLAFNITSDPVHNGKLMIGILESVWQALELVRLGRFDELKSSGVIS